MNEYLLHYIWRHRLYSTDDLSLESGEKLMVLHPGFYNRDAGPDFGEALLRIDDTRWMGSVEIHIRSSDWTLHQHQNDPAYNNVVLHVVWEHDTDALRIDGSRLPVFSLSGRVNRGLLGRYRRLAESKEGIACSAMWKGHYPDAAWQMLERAAIERLEFRTRRILELLEQKQGDWESVCWGWLARAFGQRVNADAFTRLAESLPWRIVQKLVHHPNQLDAALFGQAGFLVHPHETARNAEYHYVARKYGLQPITGLQWKRLRMYPSSFPENRLQQLKLLLMAHPRLLADFLELNTVHEAYSYLSLAWQQPGSIAPGKETIDRWLINAVIPLVFAYGQFHQLPHLNERMLHWLEELKPESNEMVRRYRNIGLSAGNALHSQGILMLHSLYCMPKRCLDCLIGQYWLTKAPP